MLDAVWVRYATAGVSYIVNLQILYIWSYHVTVSCVICTALPWMFLPVYRMV